MAMGSLWISGQQGNDFLGTISCSAKPRRFDRIITYVLLCGYTPFRSHDPADLQRETTAAKVEFHDRYWNNVSDEGAFHLYLLKLSFYLVLFQ